LPSTPESRTWKRPGWSLPRHASVCRGGGSAGHPIARNRRVRRPPRGRQTCSPRRCNARGKPAQHLQPPPRRQGGGVQPGTLPLPRLPIRQAR
jgi:hypothetical protein